MLVSYGDGKFNKKCGFWKCQFQHVFPCYCVEIWLKNQLCSNKIACQSFSKFYLWISLKICIRTICFTIDRYFYKCPKIINKTLIRFEASIFLPQFVFTRHPLKKSRLQQNEKGFGLFEWPSLLHKVIHLHICVYHCLFGASLSKHVIWEELEPISFMFMFQQWPGGGQLHSLGSTGSYLPVSASQGQDGKEQRGTDSEYG